MRSGRRALAASASLAATPPANTGSPTISGTPVEGQTLTAAAGSWSGTTPISFSYRWQRCNAFPTARLPLVGGGSLVLFIRARKPGDNVLAGVSTRRLVQVRVGRRG